jgi:glutamyl-Q tRNA(Asp) synthetase
VSAKAGQKPYVGRFAPSPTGPLHAGSVVAALASWLDARAHGGRWLVRIEDVDKPRCSAQAEAVILAQLQALGLVPDEPPLRQSSRDAAYHAAVDMLLVKGRAYPCGCTRQEIDSVLAARGTPHAPNEERVYPGTCRGGLGGRPARALRLRTQAPDGADQIIHWSDRRAGAQQQNVTRQVGDFVLRRADGLWAYQLAVVVDDAAQGITDVVRGQDLADNTARQILLQRALGLPTPRYLHVPLVLAPDGQKLSKQTGATAVLLRDDGEALAALAAAGAMIGIRNAAANTAEWRASAVAQWKSLNAGDGPALA